MFLDFYQFHLIKIDVKLFPKIVNNKNLGEIEMSDQSRRKLLKSVAAASGAIVAGKNLPESWTKPVVNSVLLPVHAQTSGTNIYSSNDVTRSASIDPQSDNMLAGLMDGLVPESKAGTTPIKGCAKIIGSYLEFEILDPDLEGGVRFKGALPLDKSVAKVSAILCKDKTTLPGFIVSMNADEVKIDIDGGDSFGGSCRSYCWRYCRAIQSRDRESCWRTEPPRMD